MTNLYNDAFVERLQAKTRGTMGAWGIPEVAELRLLCLSENATFIARASDEAAPIVLRVHRPGYHSDDEIRSELAWIKALRSDGVVSTPEPLVTKTGDQIASFDDEGQRRHVVAFTFMEGAAPDAGDDLVPGFEMLGGISARLHSHVSSWKRPDGFQRKMWDFQTAFGEDALWGDWRAAIGLTDKGRTLLERCCAKMESRLEAYGKASDRFGLVHAGAFGHLGNQFLLVHFHIPYLPQTGTLPILEGAKTVGNQGFLIPDGLAVKFG